MATVRLDISYDGTDFRGWAAQPGRRTVQAELESALGTILRDEVRLIVAGRTDAGVHAWGQVASFSAVAPPASLARRVNGLTGPDVTVNAAGTTREGFDARRDARSRSYCYRVEAAPQPSPFERGRALWWPHRLDEEALHACARALPGRHDFTAFTPTDSNHHRFERIIHEARWEREPHNPEVLRFWITGNSFLRSMVRVLVGTMLEVAGGRREQAGFQALLGGAPRERAGETAPARGLYLASVTYEGAT